MWDGRREKADVLFAVNFKAWICLSFTPNVLKSILFLSLTGFKIWSTGTWKETPAPTGSISDAKFYFTGKGGEQEIKWINLFPIRSKFGYPLRHISEFSQTKRNSKTRIGIFLYRNFKVLKITGDSLLIKNDRLWSVLNSTHFPVYLY
jgi:hypothetical protein